MNSRANIRVISCVLLFLALIGCLTVFQYHWLLECGLMAAGLFLVTSRRVWEVVVCIAVLVFLVTTLKGAIEESDPFRKPVAAAGFVDTSLPKVLQFLSKQRRTRPRWQFDIYDADLATSNVSVDFRANGTLGDALRSVCKAANCEYRWHWHKFCGNEPSPMSAVFQLWPANQPEPTDYSGGDTQVRDNSIISIRDADEQ